MSDTPETDAFQSSGNAHYMACHFARKLERERDEARTELEMWRDGNILHEIHRNELEKVERERDECYQKITDLESELRGVGLLRDKARELHRNALREREATEKEVDAMLQRAQKAERERDKWEETASLYCKNSEFNREMREKVERELELCMAANSDVARIAKERDEAKANLKITQEAWVKAKVDRVEFLRERDEAREERDWAIKQVSTLQSTFEDWQLKMLSEQAEALQRIDAEYDKLFDEAYQIRIERDSAKKHFKSIIEKANELIARWDQPSWKDTAPTARFINALRIAVRAYERREP